MKRVTDFCLKLSLATDSSKASAMKLMHALGTLLMAEGFKYDACVGQHNESNIQVFKMQRVTHSVIDYCDFITLAKQI